MTVFLGLEKIDDAGLKSVNKRNTADHNNRAIQHPAGPRHRLHAELHHRSDLGTRRLRETQALGRRDRRLQLRLLRPHAASRHRPLGRTSRTRSTRAIGSSSTSPTPSCRRSCRSTSSTANTPASGNTPRTSATRSNGKTENPPRPARRTRHAQSDVHRHPQRDAHGQRPQRSRHVPPRPRRKRSAAGGSGDALVQ